MKIAVIGATGFVGSNITNELINRNHEVLGISNHQRHSDNSSLTFVNLNVIKTEELADCIKGYDIVVSAFSSGWNNPTMYEDFIQGSTSIQQAVKLADVKRYIVIGGAGSLYVTDNLQAVDTDDFPEIFKPFALAARDYLNILKKEDSLDWLYFSPALEMHPGITTGRTGQYRHGILHPISNENGKSIISVEDVAVVIADEIESPKYNQTLFTAAY